MKIRKKGKQLFAVLLSIAMIITTMPLSAVTVNAVTTQFAGGSGTEADPYLIETKEHLNNVRNDLNAHYKMIADIVFTDADFSESGSFYNEGRGWMPIGTSTTNSFTGSFNGNNKTIKGLHINVTTSGLIYAGLFGCCNGGDITNLTVDSGSIEITGARKVYAGGICAYSASTNFYNCYNSNNLEIIVHAQSTGVEPYSYVGGVSGYGGNCTNCENKGNIITEVKVYNDDYDFAYCGGIVGGYAGTISNCTNYGNISAASTSTWTAACVGAGGIAGSASKMISNCKNYGNISCSANNMTSVYAGGICGSFSGEMLEMSYNAGTITGPHAAGIAGGLYHSTISNCYNLGEITSSDYAGGIAGYVTYNGEISGCYNVGIMNGSDNSVCIGGITGYMSSGISGDCYFLDNVSSGTGRGTATTTKCSNEEMCQSQTYTNFNFENTWEFVEGNYYKYPTLKDVDGFVINETATFNAGAGTKESPYCIASAKQLNNIRNYLDRHYKLVRNIVFTDSDFAEGGEFYNSGQGWAPIGDSKDNAFTGVLDGNNYTIENVINNLVYINSNVSGSNKIYSTYIGLFGYNKGTIRNLIVSNAKIDVQLNSIRNNAVWGNVGIICAENEGTIIDCSVSGKVRTTENYITEQTVYTDVDSDVGGITGRNTGIIRECNSKALLIGHSAGGIVGGENSQGAVIDSCYNFGIVSASNYASGICGGVNYGEITKCYNSGVVDGNRYVSGIASNNGHLIENSFNCGELVGGSFVGGIVADWNTGNINYCYNVGNINSTDYFGGIIFPSQNSESGTVSNSYYLDNIPEEVGTGRKEGTRHSYEQMQNKDSYLNFDFSAIWEFDENADYIFPTLRNIEYAKVDISIFETADGIGTWWDPYKIRTKYDLNAIRNDLSACYKLVNSISFEQSDFAEGGSFYNGGQGWKPIGSKANAFTGVFDGNGFNIENLHIDLSLNSDAYIGLFGYSKGEINNLGVIATNYVVDASNKNAYVGGIVGYSKSNISNCSAEGKINVESTSSTANEVIAGGIVGTIGADELITINSCFNDCDITVIRNITSTATSGGVATTSAGGVIGKTTSDTTILNCNNAGNIYTTYNGGQLVDIVSGGILGKSWFNTSVFDSCYNCGNITAYSPDAEHTINNHAGGIVGDAYSLNITKCYNTGNISSNHNSGGIFADTTSSVESEITDCFNVGNISSSFSSGGIGGSTEATITNCYSVGFVEGKKYGGIVGFNNGGNATVTNCFYWDIVDKGVGNWDDNAVKCSLSELKKSDTYQGFDFENDWSQSSGSNYAFPVLQGTSFVFEKELASIKIKTLPTKLKYLEAKDTLNVSGGEIELFYNNGDVSIVNLTNNMITGFNNSKVGTQTLTVTYEGKTSTFEVEVLKAYTPGDIDDNGDITLDDVVALAQIVAGWQGVAYNEAALDVNGDGSQTLDDVVLLAQYVAGWDVSLN